MTNNVYGKTMENLKKRVNVRLVNNDKDYKKYVGKPNFVLQKIFSKTLLLFMKLNQFYHVIDQSM